jgi:hypothetical protein
LSEKGAIAWADYMAALERVRMLVERSVPDLVERQAFGLAVAEVARTAARIAALNEPLPMDGEG